MIGKQIDWDDRKQYLADNLRTLREKFNITQEELAEAIGDTRNSIGTWEQCTRMPTVENLWALADYFSITINQLCGREPLPHALPNPICGRTFLSQALANENKLTQDEKNHTNMYSLFLRAP